MPTYEYRCTSCGIQFDVFQRLEEEPLRACHACGGELRKVFHPAGIVFKGSGFYATDSRAKKPSGDGQAGPKADRPTSEQGPKTDTKSSEKPAQKSTERSKAGEGSSS
jgi:putative FmdB family regulatory protein